MVSNIFLIFTPNKLGKMNPFWRAYFSKGLQPPTINFWREMGSFLQSSEKNPWKFNGWKLHTPHTHTHKSSHKKLGTTWVFLSSRYQARGCFLSAWFAVHSPISQPGKLLKHPIFRCSKIFPTPKIPRFLEAAPPLNIHGDLRAPAWEKTYPREGTLTCPYHPCMVYLPTLTMFYHKNQLNVGKYTIHGWHGMVFSFFSLFRPFLCPFSCWFVKLLVC